MNAVESRKKMVARLNAELGREENDLAWVLDAQGRAVRVVETRHDYLARLGYPFRSYETKHQEMVHPLSPLLLAKERERKERDDGGIPF